MAMTDFVVREAIVPALTATTKEAVVREIVDSLRATGYLNAAVSDDIVRQIMKREQLGSTGIGRGIAIPHTKHASVERSTGTVAVSKAGGNRITDPDAGIDGDLNWHDLRHECGSRYADGGMDGRHIQDAARAFGSENNGTLPKTPTRSGLRKR